MIIEHSINFRLNGKIDGPCKNTTDPYPASDRKHAFLHLIQPFCMRLKSMTCIKQIIKNTFLLISIFPLTIHMRCMWVGSIKSKDNLLLFYKDL